MRGVGGVPAASPSAAPPFPAAVFLTACRHGVCVVLSSLKKQGVSKGFVLPEGGQRGKTPHPCGFGRTGSSDRPLRAAVFRQNKPLRNITVFSHGEGNTYSTAAGSKKDGGRERRARRTGRRREPAGYGEVRWEEHV